MDKKTSLILVLPLFLLISCGGVTSTKPIEKDCEYLKTFLPEVSIQFSQLVDEGFDWEPFFKELKSMYVVSSWLLFSRTTPDENGINKDAFANAVAMAMQKTLKKKDSHISARGDVQSIYSFYPKVIYKSDLLFEKRADGFYLVQGSSKNVEPGMKYTGDEESLVPEYTDEKLLYRFVVIKDFLVITKVKINLNGKNKTVPVERDNLQPADSEDIFFEEKDGILTVAIKTMRPRLEKNTEAYEANVEKICKKINDYSTVVFDFRDNGGGYLESFTPIITAMIYGDIDSVYDDRIQVVNNYLYTGKVDMLTSTVANRRILEGNMMSSFYHDHKAERYYTYPEPDEKPDFSNKAFKGKIFVITNPNTCSAAEYSLAALKYLFKDQVTQLGMKTAGMLDFGGAYTYILPDSKLKIHLCCSDLSEMMVLGQGSGWRGDTEGFYPDVWFLTGSEDNIRKYIAENSAR